MKLTGENLTVDGLWPTPTSDSSLRKARYAQGGLSLGGAVLSNPLTSSVEGSPASRSALPASVLESLTNDGSGPSLREFYAFYDPGTRSLRTSQASFIEDSIPSSVTFTKRGLMRSGFAYALPTWERPTEESESLSWPTPAAQEPGWKHIRVRDAHGCEPPCHPNQRFYDAVTGRVVQKGVTQIAQMWPSPTVADAEGGRTTKGKDRPSEGGLRQAVKSWPTPMAGTDTGGHYGLAGGSGNRKKLYAMLGETDGKKMGSQSLNPYWVEWLMGFPIGWTDLGDSETRSSRKSRNTSGGKS